MSLAHSASLHPQPGSAKTVADILTTAADLIEPEGAWTQGTFARDETGKQTEVLDSSAVCFCVAGAIRRTEGQTYRAWDAFDAYTRKRGYRHMADFNDSHTQAEVVAALRAAAEKARTAAADTQVGTSNASEPKNTPTNGDSQ